MFRQTYTAALIVVALGSLMLVIGVAGCSKHVPVGEDPATVEHNATRLEEDAAKVEADAATAEADAAVIKDRQMAESKRFGMPVQITNSIGMKLVLIPSGELMMGSKESADATAAFFNRIYHEPLLKADTT